MTDRTTTMTTSPRYPTAEDFGAINADVLVRASTAMRQVSKVLSFTREALDAEPWPYRTPHQYNQVTPAQRAANRARNRNARRARATHRRTR